MTGTVGLGTIDVADAAQVAEHERHFYRAYSALTGNTLVRHIWDWDDARYRLRTRIPYADQIVYSWRDTAGQLTAAMAVNLNPATTFQGAAFGFAPHPARSGGQCCEILNVMTTAYHHGAARAGYRSFVRDFAYCDLVSRGFTTAYATCTRRRLRPYQRLGARVLAATQIRGEERFFLLWPIRELTTIAAA
jgi:hypothetical protein